MAISDAIRARRAQALLIDAIVEDVMCGRAVTARVGSGKAR
jgi:hypothetical protein